MIDRCFLRAQRPDGHWDALSMRELTPEQFRDFAVDWYQRAGARLAFGPVATTPEEREAVLAHMVKIGISPTMLAQ